MIGSSMQHRDSELIILEGESRAALREQCERLQQVVQRRPEASLVQLARDLNLSLRDNSYRLGIVASSFDDLGTKLEQALRSLANEKKRQIKARQGIYFFEEPLARDGKLAFLFPGEGSQYVGMLQDLCLHFPVVRGWFDEIDRAFLRRGVKGPLPSEFLFPTHASRDSDAGDGAEIWQMDAAVAAVTTANLALLSLLRNLDIEADVMVGHSTGDYTALLAAGIVELRAEDAFSRLMADLDEIFLSVSAESGIPRAALVAVGASAEIVEPLLSQFDGNLVIAMDNCPHQTVVAGREIAAEKFVDLAKQQGLIFEYLSFDRPYHTPMFEPYAVHLMPFFRRWLSAPPRLPTYSCTTVEPFPHDVPAMQQIAYEHWIRPVQFRHTVEKMYEDGARVFLEVGPRGNLTAFVDDILRAEPHLAIPLNVPSRSGITQLHHALAMLAAQGVAMNLEYLYEGRALPRSTTSQQKAPEAMKLSLGLPTLSLTSSTTQVNRSMNRITHAVQESSPAPAVPRSPDPPVASPGVAQVMHHYLETMEQFLEVQQAVMQAYLTGNGDHQGSHAESRTITAAARRALPAVEIEAPLAPPAPNVVPRVEADNVNRVAATPQEPAQPPAPAAAKPEPVSAPAQEAPAAEPVQDAGSRETPANGATGLDVEQTKTILLRLVSEKTGYPLEMLDPSLDLEAELGIDSIKRVEILGAFQQETALNLSAEMEELSAQKSLQGIAEYVVAAKGAATSPNFPLAPPTPAPASVPEVAAVPAYPFVGQVVTMEPGDLLVARCTLDPEQFPFLRDHTLGRNVSRLDPDLTGLPVLPFTMSMEILAEAAALLAPGKVLTSMTEVRVNRWVTFEDKPVTVEIEARRVTGRTDEFEVEIREVQAGERQPAPVVTGTLRFAREYPEAPAAPPMSLVDERPSTWKPDELYTRGIFHGPAFQGTRSIDRWGENGVTATLEVLPRGELFQAGEEQVLLTDPVLLDQPGQVIAFWLWQLLDRGHIIFPYRLERIDLFGPPPPAGETMRCQGKVTEFTDLHMRSDLDIVRASGQLWARLIGWEDRRFVLPLEFSEFILAPARAGLSREWRAPLENVSQGKDFAIFRLGLHDLPERFLTAHGGIWQRVLAYGILGRRERALWHSLRTPERRRLEWLLGRLAAKDAVRHHLQEHEGLYVAPADIEIVPDAAGRPEVHGSWLDQVSRQPLLSLAHSNGMVIAIAGATDGCSGIGIDIESQSAVQEQTETLAFTAGERELLANLDVDTRREWAARFWCAKEAVAKALGTGMTGGPQSLVVQRVGASEGTLELRLEGPMAEQFGQEQSIIARTSCESGQVVAVALQSQSERTHSYVNHT
jgi:phosphopantetheine--protein transferase-like protein